MVAGRAIPYFRLKYKLTWNNAKIQSMLNEKYKARLKVDGVFGPKTIQAINNIEDRHQLSYLILQKLESNITKITLKIIQLKKSF